MADTATLTAPTATTPPPPAGFTEDPPPPSGFTVTPDAAAAPPPPSGFSETTPPPTATPWYDTAGRGAVNVMSGIGGSVLDTALWTADQLNHPTRTGPPVSPELDQWIQAHRPELTEQQGAAQKAGGYIGNILQFVAGEEPLKALELPEKLSKLAGLEQTLAKSPVLSRMFSAAITAPPVGTTLALAQGASPGSALAQGGAAGVLGAAGEGVLANLGKLRQLIAPTTENILGETTPVLASQTPGGSPLAESIADIRSEPEIAAQQQQALTRGITNRAQQVTRSVLNMVNESRAMRWREGEGVMNLAPEAAETTPQLTSGAPQLPAPNAPTNIEPAARLGPYEGDLAEPQPSGAQPATGAPGQRVRYVEEAPPNFAPIDIDQAVSGIRDFGHARDVIQQHTAPVFQRFNDATGGEYTRLRDLRDAAYSADDYAGVARYERQIDDLFNWHDVRGQIDRFDYRTAKNAWRISKVLDGVHDAISKAYNIPDQALAEEAGVWRGVNGGSLMRAVNRLVERHGANTLKEILGPDAVSGLYRASALTQTPQRAALYGAKVGNIADGLAGVVPGGRAIPHTVNWIRRMLLHGMATNPRVANAVEFATSNRIAPRIYRPLIGAMLGLVNHRQQQEQTTP